MEYHHPRLGFRLPVPDGWEQLEDAHDSALIVVEPISMPRFLPNVVVTVGELSADASLHEWLGATIELLRERVPTYWALDAGVTEVDGRPVCRVLGHHLAPAGSVTMEQWSRFAPGLCYTVTTSVGTLQYPAYCELFAGMAAGLTLPGEAHDRAV